MKRFLIYIIPILLSCFVLQRTAQAQCLELADGFGNFTDNPYYIGCLGTDLTVFIQPNRVVGAYTIDWGDGSPIEAGPDITPPATISHVYAATVDTFVITLTEGACVVTGVAVLEQTPAAAIVLTNPDNFGCAPAIFNFENQTTNVSQTTNFTWNYGDGSPVETYDYTNQGQTVAHTYMPMTANCNMAVTLTAENYCNQGNPSSSVFSPIQVWDVDDANIDASETLLCYPDTTVTLTNTTQLNCNTLAQGNTSQRYEYWNLGDYWGTGSDSIIDWRPITTFPMTVAYPGLGTYTAMLIDSSFCGLDTAFTTIQIVTPPTSALSASDDTICEGEMVTFNDLSGGGANVYSWNFGDGLGWQAIGPGNVTNTFNISGDYTIEFAVGIAGGTGCFDTSEVNLHVLVGPVPNFLFGSNNGCDTLTVSFNNTSTELATDTIETWQWDFDNGNTSTMEDPPAQFYNTSGVYDVELTVTTQKNCSVTENKTLYVYDSPGANFSVQSVCEDAVATFTDLSTESPLDTITNWLWDFGDGNTSTLEDPTHIYTTPGAVNVELIVNSAYCADSITIPLTIETVPTAIFTSSVTDGCAPLTSDFTNVSVGAVSYKWYFGDGDSASTTNASHQFQNTFGIDTTYTVMLVAQTLFGCTDTTTDQVTVYPIPSAMFTNDAVVDCAPLIVNYTNNSTGAVSYEWDFGDGSPIETAPDPTHTHQNATQFISVNTIELVAISANGCRDSVETSITIYPEPNFNFTAAPDSGCSPLEVDFPAMVGAAAYDWDFGDGATGTGPTPIHTYINTTTNDLVFNVQLIATSPFACRDTNYADVLVYPNPNAQFDTDTTMGCHPATINFTNNSTGGVTYHWDFGSGDAYDTSIINFDYEYQNITGVTQTFEVLLIAETDKECTDTASETITVYPDVVASFSSDTAGCTPYNIDFINFSTGGDSYSWDFGDLSPADTNQQTSHQFVNTTTLDMNALVRLMVTSSFGCVDSSDVMVTIYPKPVAQYDVDSVTGCHPLLTNFTNTSTGASFYYWNLGDGTAYDTTNVGFTYAYSNIAGIAQTYPSVLIVETDKGCLDTANQDILVYPDVTAAFDSDTAGCSPYYVEFTNFSLGTTTYQWTFGDTASAVTDIHTEHTFFNGSFNDTSYVTTLIAQSDFGCRDTLTQEIMVFATPEASFEADSLFQVYPNATVNFTNTSSSGVWEYEWDFGDSTISVEQQPDAYEYATWGDYQVELIVRDTTCSDTAFETISIVPPVPIADFEGAIVGCQPVAQQFINNSEYGETYFWDFGDGFTSSVEEPIHVYNVPGTYSVTLTVTGLGGVDTLEQEDIVEVYTQPTAFFTMNPTVVFLPDDPIFLYNLSSFADYYLWNFGDGDTSSLEFPEYIYDEPGIYDVQLIAYTENNCLDTFTIVAGVEAIAKGSIEFPNAFTPSLSGSSGGKINEGDPSNDVFYPLIDGAIEYELNIFNKWGELLFISEDVTIGWDGYYRGEICKQDVYIYKIKVKFIDGRTESYVGDVTLLR